MGCSWFTYAGTFTEIETGYLLIPEYAQEWAGTDKFTITQGGDYADFAIKEAPLPSYNYLNGHTLIRIFEKLYNDENVPVSLNDCFYEKYEYPYENETLENLRSDGIFSHADRHNTPYSLKITKNPKLTYETCPYFSPCGQFSYEDEEKEESEKHSPHYQKEWNYYFKEKN